MAISTNAQLVPLLQQIDRLLEKCGGRGGKPGPCSGGDRAKPDAGAGAKPATSGKKPPKKPAGGKKPPKYDGPGLTPLNMGKPKDNFALKPLGPQGKTAWHKALSVGYLAFGKASQNLGKSIEKIKSAIDGEFKISGMAKEIKAKVTGFVAKAEKLRTSIESSVKASRDRVHKILDGMEASLSKAAPPKLNNRNQNQNKPIPQPPAGNSSKATDTQLQAEMNRLENLTGIVTSLDDAAGLVHSMLTSGGSKKKEQD